VDWPPIRAQPFGGREGVSQAGQHLGWALSTENGENKVCLSSGRIRGEALLWQGAEWDEERGGKHRESFRNIKKNLAGNHVKRTGSGAICHKGAQVGLRTW